MFMHFQHHRWLKFANIFQPSALSIDFFPIDRMRQIILFCTPTLFFYMAVPGKIQGAVLGKARGAECLMPFAFAN